MSETKKGRPPEGKPFRPTVTIRLQRETIEALDRVAKEEHRSRSAQVEWIIEQYVKNRK